MFLANYHYCGMLETYQLGHEQRTVSCRTCTAWVLKCTMLSTSLISSLKIARSEQRVDIVSALKIHSSYLQLIFPSIPPPIFTSDGKPQAGSGYRYLHRAQHGCVPWLPWIPPCLPSPCHDRGKGTPLRWKCGVNSFNLPRWRSSFVPLGAPDGGLGPEDGTVPNRKVVACFSLKTVSNHFKPFRSIYRYLQ